jgi:amino acid transporter
MVFGVHCISLSSSGLIPFSWVASVWPGASIIGVLTVAMLLGLFHAYSYAAIGAAMPRSGADYVLGSRVLHPTLAFAASWVLGIFSGIVAGGLIAWIPGTALPTLARTIGIIFENQAAVDFASWSASSTGILVIGTICVLVTWMTMLLPTQRIVRILEVGFFLGVAAWIVIFIVLATAPGPSAF